MIMPICSPIACLILLFLAPVQTGSAQTNSTPEVRNSPGAIPHSARLQGLVDRAVNQALEKFAAKKLATNQIAVTLVDSGMLHDPSTLDCPCNGKHPQSRPMPHSSRSIR